MKGILFDFFGVICTEVAEPWFEKYGSMMTYQEFRAKHIRPYDAGEVSDEATWDALAYISGQSKEEVKKEWIELATINTDLVEYIRQLSNIYKIALITNAGSGFFWAILDANDINTLFSTIVVSSKEKITKPDRRIYEIALERMKLSAEDILFVDDRVENLEGAKALNIQGIQYESLIQLKKDLTQLGITCQN